VSRVSRHAARRAVVAIAVGAALAACGSPAAKHGAAADLSADSTPTSTTASPTSAATVTPTAQPAAPPPAAVAKPKPAATAHTLATGTGSLAGQVIVIDPGHNGGNASHPSIINAMVDAGFGLRKACNTTGTATNAGYSEAAYTFDVALRLSAVLRARGAKVVMTRTTNSTPLMPRSSCRSTVTAT
jgi:N-acetylmuramoyl-L-alanine amidase